ncbi:MAG: hypothetical protein AAGF47_12635, partial [Planctomycetota bacterium]
MSAAKLVGASVPMDNRFVAIGGLLVIVLGYAVVLVVRLRRKADGELAAAVALDQAHGTDDAIASAWQFAAGDPGAFESMAVGRAEGVVASVDPARVS